MSLVNLLSMLSAAAKAVIQGLWVSGICLKSITSSGLPSLRFRESTATSL